MSASFGLCTLVQLQPADEKPVSERVRGPGGGECILMLAIAFFFFAIAKLLLEYLCFGFGKRKNAEASAVFCKVPGSDARQVTAEKIDLLQSLCLLQCAYCDV